MQRSQSEGRQTKLTTIKVGALLLIMFGFASHLLEPWLPAMTYDGEFTLFAKGINAVGGVLFVMVGVSFLNDFRWNREPLLFVLAVGMFLFAESQFLFAFSKLWDVPWWAWHGIKAGIFIAILVGLAYAFGQSFAFLETSRRQVLDAYRRLEAAQANLVEAEKLVTLGHMAAGIAHEIRNPLAAITNCVSVLKYCPVSTEERAELLSIIEREIDRIAKIISDTLGLARTSKFRRRESVSLSYVVEKALASIPPHEKGQVSIQRDISKDLPLVNGDASQLEEVAWNLLMNAFQALAGHGEIRIRAFREGDQAVLAVADTGPGIPETVQARIFEPFFSTRPDGTGLGLTIVQRIVKEHGGSIAVKSSPQRGTEVIVRLPITQMTQVDDKPNLSCSMP